MFRYTAPTENTVSEREQTHRLFSQKIAEAGMVLLKNDGTLPLEEQSTIALFGYGAVETAVSGSGAGGVHNRKTVSVLEGLKAGGVRITTEAYLQKLAAGLETAHTEYYAEIKRKCGSNYLAGVRDMYANPFVMPEEPLITEADIQSEVATVSIYVLSRNSGEGADRKNVRGDYRLLESELENLRFLSAHFSKLILLLNTGGQIEMDEILTLPNLSAILYIGLPGCTAGNAAANLLLGRSVPEGKLTQTWARRYSDYPTAREPSCMNDPNEAFYKEGLFVGYRYFDSFGVEPVFAFGFGESYTQFAISPQSFSVQGDQVHIDVCVENIGDKFAARETVQIYVHIAEGTLLHPYQRLIAFRKTKLLAPKEKEHLSFEISLQDLASYSEADTAWIIDSGKYSFYIGNSSRKTAVCGKLYVCEKIVLRHSCKILSGEAPERGLLPTCADVDNSGDGQEVHVKHIPINVETETCPKQENFESHEESELRYTDICSGEISAAELVAAMSDEELATLCVGNVAKQTGRDERGAVLTAGFASDDYEAAPNQEDFVETVVPGAAVTTRALQERRGIPKLNMADGSSGIRLVPVYETDAQGKLITDGFFSIPGVERFADVVPGKQCADSTVRYQNATGLPMATLLAQTWDTQCMEACGRMIAQEMEVFGLDLWLAPALNLQRDPLCGRNFEYFSEDPLLSGKCAAALTRGCQSKPGKGATIKHFACNNQEDNRSSLNVHISERALRELYLKGFEIAVRESEPAAIMTSLNLIDGTHAANHFGMLQQILRKEWNYTGVVMTDWGTTVEVKREGNHYPAAKAWECIRCGNDLIMPGTAADIENILCARRSGQLKREALECSAYRILKMMLRLRNDIERENISGDAQRPQACEQE